MFALVAIFIPDSLVPEIVEFADCRVATKLSGEDFSSSGIGRCKVSKGCACFKEKGREMWV